MLCSVFQNLDGSVLLFVWYGGCGALAFIFYVYIYYLFTLPSICLQFVVGFCCFVAPLPCPLCPISSVCASMCCQFTSTWDPMSPNRMICRQSCMHKWVTKWINEWQKYTLYSASIWGQFGVNLVSIWCQYGVNMVSIWCHYGVNPVQYGVIMVSIQYNMVSIRGMQKWVTKWINEWQKYTLYTYSICASIQPINPTYQSNLSIQPINPCQSGSIWLNLAQSGVNLGSIWGQYGVCRNEWQNG